MPITTFQQQYNIAEANIKFLSDYKNSDDFGNQKIREIKRVNYLLVQYRNDLGNALYGIEYEYKDLYSDDPEYKQWLDKKGIKI